MRTVYLFISYVAYCDSSSSSAQNPSIVQPTAYGASPYLPCAVPSHRFWIDEGNKYCFSKTQAVVLDLLLQEDESGKRCLPPGKHIVWLDNLFTSVQLFIVLRLLGIGAAGTVRTTTTKREIIESAEIPEVEEVEEDTEEQFEENSDLEDSEDSEALEIEDNFSPPRPELPRNPPPKTPFSEFLIRLKKEYDSQISWGQLYSELS